MGKRVKVAKGSSAEMRVAYVRVSTPQPKRTESRRRQKRPEASRG